MTRLVSVLFAALLSGAACRSSTDAGDDYDDPPNGSMSARIDGSSWRAFAISVTWENNTLSIAGADPSNTAVALVAIDPAHGTVQRIEPGSPTTLSVNVSGTGAGSGLWTANAERGTGTLNIDAFSATSASGRFSFEAPANPFTGATGTKVVTQGTFSVTF